MTVRFGPFMLSVSRRELSRDGAPLHLTPKAFDLLTLLLGEAPRVVPKREIHERLWPGTFVSDATLVGLVKELRRALDDRDPGAPIIRTAHRFGYAFCPGVEADQPPRAAACHWLVVSGRRIVLREGENRVGRDPASHVWLDSTSVSRTHARIVVGSEHAVLEDCGSKNGTRVGNQPATRATTLQDGDRVGFGSVAAVYRSSSSGMSTETHAGSGLRSRSVNVRRLPAMSTH
jgi:DNA-binding winged helix-turn-helix (wHTH) protein